MNISGNEISFPSFPQRHDRRNDLSFPQRREIYRPGKDANNVNLQGYFHEGFVATC